MNAQNPTPGVFDVFLCHNSEDKPAVREIAKRLAEKKIKPWLDEEQIRPGTTWQTTLGQQVAAVKSAAVFVGASGLGPWQGEEIQSFLNEFMERGLPVIPTILPSVSGTPELPWTLKNRHRVDFRISDPDPVKQLIWGITGKKPTPRESLIPDKNELSEPRRRYSESRLYPPLAEPSNQENRTQLEILRRRVDEYWVDGVLKHSLYNEVLISLGKRQVEEFVDAPWKYNVQVSDGIHTGALAGRSVSSLYDATGLLLILGEPGSGKTTTLLDLARTLLDRAEKDIRERVPVVLNLSRWKKQPLVEWISGELSEKYRVTRKTGQSWLKNNYLLLLLDGLDEVETSLLADCVAAINRFIDEFNPSGLVVCCRLNEYRWLPERLKLNGAIRLEPLSEDDVDEYLSKGGAELAKLREAVKTDPVLKELTETPLMLNIMSLAFQGTSGNELIGQAGDSSGERQRQIFRIYIDQMFRRKETRSPALSQDKMIGWLSWLAWNMREHAQSVFLVEGLQPSWLASRAKRVAYGTVVALSLGLIFGLIFGLSTGLIFGQIFGLIFGLTYGVSILIGVGLGCWSESPKKNGVMSGSIGALVAGLMGFMEYIIFMSTISGSIGVVKVGLYFELISGLLVGLIGGLIAWLVGALIGSLGVGSLNHIALVETISWKWGQYCKSANSGLILAFICGLGVGLAGGVNIGLIFGAIVGAIALVFGLVGGMTDKVKVDKESPNQGINLSLKNSLAVFLVVGLTVWLIAEPIVWLNTEPIGGLMVRLVDGLIAGLIVGLIVGLNRGGSAVIKHYALRLILWKNENTPFNFVKFLDHCARLILLQKVGGGYIFIHRMLLEYFAELNSSVPKKN